MLPGIHQLMSPETITTVRTSQVYGTLGNPNHLGLYCAMMLPLFCQELSLAPLLTTVMLVASGSRLGVVGAFAGCTYIVLKKSPRLLWMVVPSFIALFAYLVHTHHMDVGRWYIWKVSLAATWKHVLIGAGPSTLLNYIPQGEPGIYSNAIIDRPHNLYLQVWHAAGLPALLALLSLGYLTFKNAKVQYRAAIIGFATAAFFTDSFVGVTPIFFALLGNSWRSDDV
jgi:O-antigen ligase